MMKKALNIIQNLIIVVLVIILLINLYLLAQRHLFNNSYPTIAGYSESVVVSGSMSPRIKIDDVVVSKKVSHYKKGEIIVFENGNDYVVHRIVEVKGNTYITKGDANDSNDQNPIKESEVKGKVVHTLSGLGPLINSIKSPIGILIILVIILLVFELENIIKLFKRKE